MKTITLTTPKGNHKVEIKEWITGADAEKIEELSYEAVSVKTDATGRPDLQNIDIKKIVTETNHRKIQLFVISVDGKTEDLVNAVLQMPEQDTEFILNAIDNQRKKK